MERRLFIAVELPETLTDSLGETMRRLGKLLPPGARIMPRENWHITLSFLGEQDEAQIPAISRAMREMKIPEGVEVTFDRILYGPPRREPPQMLWLTAIPKTSADLGQVRDDLESRLREAGVEWKRDEFPNFSGHVTLARFDAPRYGVRPIDYIFDGGFVARTLVLMESNLTPEGPIYREVFRSWL